MYPSSSKTEHVPPRWGRRRSENRIEVGGIYSRREGQPTTLTLAITTPLPPTSGARFLPHSGANRRDLCYSPRSSGVSVVSVDAGAAQRRSRETPRSSEWWKNRWWDRVWRRKRKRPRVGWTWEEAWWGPNPENVSDEDGNILLSGRAERQNGSRRTGVSLSLPLSLAAYRSVLVPFHYFSHFHAPRGEAEEQFDGGARAGLLRGETLARCSVFSDQTARQCGPSWTVSSSLFLLFFLLTSDDNWQIRLKTSNNYSHVGWFHGRNDFDLEDLQLSYDRCQEELNNKT